MECICKSCKKTKPREAFPTRHWTTPSGVKREGPRKVCYDCQRAIDLERYNAPNSRKRARQAEWRKENAERINHYGRVYYEVNRDKWLDPETGWRFSERARHYDETYRERPASIEMARTRGKRWRAENKARLVVKTRKRQAHVARATPLWANEQAILALYEQAARLTKETGERYEVDHVIPLQGKNVCGLHVETNLRVIPASANRRKHNRFEPVTSLSPTVAA